MTLKTVDQANSNNILAENEADLDTTDALIHRVMIETAKWIESTEKYKVGRMSTDINTTIKQNKRTNYLSSSGLDISEASSHETFESRKQRPISAMPNLPLLLDQQ